MLVSILLLAVAQPVSAQYRIVDTFEYGKPAFEVISIQERVAQMKIEERKSYVGEILEMSPHNLGRNCVGFVRGKRTLPQPLLTLADKKRIINSDKPVVGAVAITSESWYGHLSVVLEIKYDTIVIEEGNYISGFRTVRVINKDFPIGYYL